MQVLDFIGRNWLQLTVVGIALAVWASALPGHIRMLRRK